MISSPSSLSFLLLFVLLASLPPPSTSFQFFKLNTTKPTTNPIIHLVAVGPTILNEPTTWCAVESLLRSAHPESHPLDIFIWHDEPLSLTPSTTNLIGQLKKLRGNVHFLMLNFRTIFHATPLEKLYTEEGLTDMSNSSMWERYGRLWKQNLCNAARMSILYKFGGTYIDLDHIVFKDVRLLPTPGLAFQSASRPNNAAMTFPIHHPFLGRMMTKFVSTYNGNAWGHNGPDLLRGMVHSCHTQAACGLSFFKGVFNYKTFNPNMFVPDKKESSRGLKGWMSGGGISDREKEKRKKYLSSILDQLKEEIIFHTWHHVTRIPDAAEIEKYHEGSGGVLGYGTTPLGYLRLKHCPCSTFKLIDRSVEEVSGVIGEKVDVGMCSEGGNVDEKLMEHGEQFLYGVLAMRGEITKEERDKAREEQRGELFKRKHWAN